jgi:hypothetical protein
LIVRSDQGFVVGDFIITSVPCCVVRVAVLGRKDTEFLGTLVLKKSQDPILLGLGMK